jgi:hypothetical protein
MASQNDNTEQRVRIRGDQHRLAFRSPRADRRALLVEVMWCQMVLAWFGAVGVWRLSQGEWGARRRVS